MKKIMFSDKFGLTEAVLSGQKTQTRRVYKTPRNSYGGLEVENNCIITFDANGCEVVTSPIYKVGEVVAVAMSYKTVVEHLAKKSYDVAKWLDDHNITSNLAGWLNKMFVRADLMPHRIRITNVRVERLQDISYEDCMAEGVCKWTKDKELFKYDMADGFDMFEWRDMPRTPREAYAALIDRISGKGTWDSNPYVFVYEFELVK